MPPAMQLIRSADLLAVGYEKDRCEFWVRFRTRPGLVYGCSAVPHLV